ncbi:LOW QUALITY PROTEIN: hypothetical protein ACHAXN_010937 [Cyclotella atomus]
MCINSKEECVDSVFDNFEHHIRDANYFKSRILLAATNEIVNEVNGGMMPGDMHEFASVDTVGDINSCTMFPTKFLNSLSLSGLPEHILRLKKDTVMILLCNMDIKGGHCNGIGYLVTVTYICKYRQKCYGDFASDTYAIRRTEFSIRVDTSPVPNQNCFCSHNKQSPGSVRQKMWCLASKNLCTHGQIYVAFSCCGNPENIFVLAKQPQFDEYELEKGKTYMKNVVYTKVI